MHSLALVLCFFCLSQALLCYATTYTVIVGPGYTFSPSSLQIEIGDSVVFNKSNVGFHNIHETTSNYFYCSVNCATTGATTCSGTCGPTSTAWVQTIGFTANASYAYQCDEHYSLGMTGTITVGSGSPPATTTTAPPTTTTTTPPTTTTTAPPTSPSSSPASTLRPFYLWY